MKYHKIERQMKALENLKKRLSNSYYPDLKTSMLKGGMDKDKVEKIIKTKIKKAKEERKILEERLKAYV